MLCSICEYTMHPCKTGEREIDGEIFTCMRTVSASNKSSRRICWSARMGCIPVSTIQAKDLIAKAIRTFPVGGFPEKLPPVLAAISAQLGKFNACEAHP